MRKFLVKVNGTDYEVEVEEISGKRPEKESGSVAQPPKVEDKPPAAPSSAAQKSAPSAAAPAVAAGETAINAPMPGNILSIAAKAGDAVKKGQVLLILEAMKMENEILAPKDCIVSAVYVQAGATVDTGVPLLSIK